ncbi:hypothetical protein BDZ85DRAFT_269833 [Elsinoe ampelina]|uniref:Uncharacterized protein n=1 Tax=Elsinoe ampelina TaxID=302913 RepID=A0A6A6FZP4_9PEZI|nr:hypothetical protein BDZ85DRAFT_269833 [Elsinoe ampelina]
MVGHDRRRQEHQPNREHCHDNGIFVERHCECHNEGRDLQNEGHQDTCACHEPVDGVYSPARHPRLKGALRQILRDKRHRPAGFEYASGVTQAMHDFSGCNKAVHLLVNSPSVLVFVSAGVCAMTRETPSDGTDFAVSVVRAHELRRMSTGCGTKLAKGKN